MALGPAARLRSVLELDALSLQRTLTARVRRVHAAELGAPLGELEIQEPALATGLGHPKPAPDRLRNTTTRSLVNSLPLTLAILSVGELL